MVALVARVLLLMVLGVCPRLPWPGLGGSWAHRLWWLFFFFGFFFALCNPALPLGFVGLWWLWFPPVAVVAGGDADGGVMPAMVCLMPLAWVLYVLEPVEVCVGLVGNGAGGAGVGEGVVLA